RLQSRDHLVQRQMVVAQRDIELVENHERKTRVGHQLLRLGPGALSCCHVSGDILRLPGEARTHRVPRHLIAEFLKRIALRAVPATFDELHDADALASSEHAEREAEGCRRFALAGAGVDDEQALLELLAGDFLVLHRLALRHLGAMALGLLFVDTLRHGLFTATAMPTTIMITRDACAASR